MPAQSYVCRCQAWLQVDLGSPWDVRVFQTPCQVPALAPVSSDQWSQASWQRILGPKGKCVALQKGMPLFLLWRTTSHSGSPPPAWVPLGAHRILSHDP